MERLRSYWAKARRGERFTAADLKDYTTLVEKMREEHPGEPGIWFLMALGAFLLSLWLGGKKEKEHSD